MIYFNNRNVSSGLTGRLICRLISATAIYGRWNSSLCWKGRWYPTIRIRPRIIFATTFLRGGPFIKPTLCHILPPWWILVNPSQFVKSPVSSNSWRGKSWMHIFPKSISQLQMILSRIWTQVATSIFYNNNHYSMSSSIQTYKCMYIPIHSQLVNTVLYVTLIGWFLTSRCNIRGSLNKFPDFFCMATFIYSTHVKL